MKTPLKIGAMIILMMTVLWLVPKKASAQNENVNLQVFYDELGSYGTWVDNPTYGYVWVPNVNNDFKPYVTDGHWVFTDYGWTWSSDLPWGWATFHYGRWYWDEEYGNVWVPGTEWGPAWVVWKKTPGYYGWAPMTPGMTTLYSRSNLIPVESWCFVRDQDLMQNDLSNYYVDPMRYSTLIRNSSLIFSMRYNSRFKYSYIFGPSQMEFQRYYGRTLNPIRIYDSYRPGQSLDRDRYSIYRPQFNPKGSSAYHDSRPQSYLRNNERINVNSNNNYYRNQKEKENGRPTGLYNNSSRNRDNNSNDARRPNDQNKGNYNNNNSTRPTYTTDPVRNERPSSSNNYNRGNPNTSSPGNSNNTNRGTGNNNNRSGSTTTGSGNTNTPATGNIGNNRGRSNASGTGNTTNPNAGATSPTNTGRGNTTVTPQTNKPATPQTNTPADPTKVKPGTTTNPQKPAADPKAKGQKGTGTTTPKEKRGQKTTSEVVK